MVAAPPGPVMMREVVAKDGLVFFMKEKPLQMQSTELIYSEGDEGIHGFPGFLKPKVRIFVLQVLVLCCQASPGSMSFPSPLQKPPSFKLKRQSHDFLKA